MLFFSNTTTERLEGFARARGVEVGICKTPGNATGLFHVVAEGGKPLRCWVSLGWTRAEAEAALERWTDVREYGQQAA